MQECSTEEKAKKLEQSYKEKSLKEQAEKDAKLVEDYKNRFKKFTDKYVYSDKPLNEEEAVKNLGSFAPIVISTYERVKNGEDYDKIAEEYANHELKKEKDVELTEQKRWKTNKEERAKREKTFWGRLINRLYED